MPVQSVEDAAKTPRGGPCNGPKLQEGSTRSIVVVAAALIVFAADWASRSAGSGATPTPAPATVQKLTSEPTRPFESTAEAAYNHNHTPDPPLACLGINPPPKPDQDMWKQLRDAYRATIGEWESTDSVDFPSNDDESDSGIRVPYEVNESPGKGYGIFAAANVKRGDVIFDKATKYTAKFWEENDYVDFLSHMPHELACRVLHWTCLGQKDSNVIMSELADASLINGNDKDNANVGCIGTVKECKARISGGDDREYALRDIAAGEELIEDYSLQLDMGNFDWWEKYWHDGMNLGDWGPKLNAVYGAEKKEQRVLAALRRQKIRREHERATHEDN